MRKAVLKQNNLSPTGVNVKDGFIKEVVVKDRLVPVILERYRDQLPIDEGIVDLTEVDEAILTDLPKETFQKQTFNM